MSFQPQEGVNDWLPVNIALPIFEFEDLKI
jgi:hypothetical protein